MILTDSGGRGAAPLLPLSPPLVRVSLRVLSPFLSLLLLPVRLPAQTALAAPDSAAPPSTGHVHYWRLFAAGAATSLFLHEAAHVGTALALGAHPSFGFDKGRPTVYSGIDPVAEPRKQFLFSSMGLNVQAALDEAILDTPHHRGAPFERGVVAAGIATALFYVTIGRTASVSDVDFMARTSSLSKTDLTLLYGGVALLHVARIHRDGRYANFFLRPDSHADGGVRVGVRIQ